MPIEWTHEDDVDKLRHLMVQSFEQAEFLYWKARLAGAVDPVVLVATSEGQVATGESKKFDDAESHRALLEGAVIRRRIASNSAEPITVTVFPRAVLAHLFEENGYPDLAQAIALSAPKGKMTLLLMKDDDYRFIERNVPDEM